jgi:DNA-binding GntR family transcriptional regulator
LQNERMSEDTATRDGQNVALVHEQLRRAILAGDIPPGQATSQIVLARELGVGRTPLREALRMLQHEGLVLSQPNRRVRIAEVSVEDLEELYVARIALESVAVRLTVPKLAPEDIAVFEGLMAQMDSLVELGSHAINTAHYAFHAGFVKGAGERPAVLMAQLFDHAERYRRIYAATAPDQWPKRRAEHRAILDAAKSGDGDATADALAIHYVRTAKLVAAGLDPDYELERLRATLAAVAPGAAAEFDQPGLGGRAD